MNQFTSLFSLKTRFSPYTRKMHTGEVALILGLLLAFLITSWLTREQNQLADGMIRLHIVANSDSEADQQLKYDVRDRVLAEASTLFPEGISSEEAEEILQNNLCLIQEVGEAVAMDYTVTAQVEEVWFPTKHYEDFSLPAGNYLALNVEIGEGDGENWWCVAYPPLCVGAASQTVEEAVEAGNFSLSQKEMMTGEGYVLKFKSMEWLEQFKHWVSGE